MRVLAMPKQRWKTPCEKFVGYGDFCKRCEFHKGFVHDRTKHVICSQCSGKFLPRFGYETGYSHCDTHRSAVK